MLSFSKEVEYFKAVHGLKQFTTQEGFFEKFETSELNQIMKNTKKKDASTLNDIIFKAHDLESDTKVIARAIKKSQGVLTVSLMRLQGLTISKNRSDRL